MAQHVLREIDKLKQKILSMASAVEETFLTAARAAQERDEAAAQRVIEEDFQIDDLEVDVEEECLKLLALYQPVAIDLRFIVSVLKINSDLERVGDLAVNIAERALFLIADPPLRQPIDFSAMADKTREMLGKSIDALVRSDVTLAREVRDSDDVVDDMNSSIYTVIRARLRNEPESVDRLIHHLGIARHLERIADHATNIAEDVIYMVEGEIVRHRPEDYCAPQED